MAAKTPTTVLVLLLVGVCAFASLGPVAGTENIPELVADSTLVCKGEVISAPMQPSVLSSVGMARDTTTAEVRPDRCFKGTPPRSSIPVLFDRYASGVDPGSLVLRPGDYRLFFLTPQNGAFAVVDKWFGALPVSRELSPVRAKADAMTLLEFDLKAGLRDSDPERVLDSIRMLGNMRRLHSTAELKRLLDSRDLLTRTYVWQALLRLRDYSVMPAVADFFNSQPNPPHELVLPRDRLFDMEFELVREIANIRDSSALPFLEQFAVTKKLSLLRSEALQALRAIGSISSAATFLAALDDPNPDNAFSAMQGLLSLAGGGPISWVPTWKQFDDSPQFYATKCREWWATEGEPKAKSQAQHTLRFILSLPENVRSDLVQIHYVAIRSGNGYAEILRQPAKQNAYELAEAADKVKVLAYLPGCQFDILELSAGMATTQPLPCRPLRTVQFKGQITNPELLAGKSAVVDVSVVAHQIFGVVDEMFTRFRLAPSPIDSSGAFTLSLPDFASDPAVKSWEKGSEWQFAIRELKMSNPLARLRAAHSDDEAPGLAIQSSYENIVKCTAVPD
jgi:hypothetical protein